MSHPEEPPLSPHPPFSDTSDECAICLSPLAAAPTLTLACGHRWHTECVRAQLRHAAPDPSRRLAFAGAACAKCGTWADHPDLRDVAAIPAAVRAAVDALLRERLGPGADVAAARRAAAFYLCSVCGDPFYGGEAACGGGAGDSLSPEERQCPPCVVRGAAAAGAGAPAGTGAGGGAAAAAAARRAPKSSPPSGGQQAGGGGRRVARYDRDAGGRARKRARRGHAAGALPGIPVCPTTAWELL